jgi:actin-related protein 8
MVIARPSAATFKPLAPLPLRLREDPESEEPLFGQTFEEGAAKLDGILKARLKAAKKRSVPNARELVASYNRRSQCEELLDINDPEQIEWIDLGPERKYCTGDAVLSHFKSILM